MADPDDELARTATAHDGAPTADPARPLGAMIGRYRLERELGQGGMGVVHVAFDPDLERRVALKVLRASTSREAAQRLQREARAMARLNHPNVVTVHEVGTSDGRDYVAMELIEGDTLADWLRAGERSVDEIVDAFVQAGQGLAAAHAAGIVHRDFKPHNVLRSHSGLIEVTDFGLAREAHVEGASSDPLASTLPVLDAVTAAKTPSSLSGLTVTGSLLGTPAYMAPEQWSGGSVTPATDQFAFSVALWEALCGERPFKGPTVEALREQVIEGPSQLDASKLPRRLRAVLRRGLDPDPKRRWPSMAAMLAAIRRRGRGGTLAVAAGGAAVVAGVLIAFALSGGREEAPRCAAPAVKPAAVWSERSRAALLDNGHTAAVRLLDADLGRWTGLREQACAAPIERRTPMLACLDHVLQTMDATVRAAAQVTGVAQVDVGAILIDPRVCTAERPPRLSAPSPQLQDVIVTRLREAATPGPSDKAMIATLVERVASDPCASSYAYELQLWSTRDLERRRSIADLADTAAERCEDERVRADAAIRAVQVAVTEEFIGSAITKKLRQAEVAVARVAQADLLAELDVVRMNLAARVEDLDSALQRTDAAIAGFAARGRISTMIEVGLAGLSLYQVRATPADLAEIARRIAAWRELVTKELGPKHDALRRVEQVDARWAFARGDVAGAQARLAAARRPVPIDNAIAITGRVVDPAGKPVAGATVVTGKNLVGTSVSVALAEPEGGETMRTTTTAADGTFAIPDAVADGIVVAQLGDLRSFALDAADGVELRLRPTSRIEGKVDLRELPSTRVSVYVMHDDQARHLRYGTVAPVARDGTFAIDGAPRGTLKVIIEVAGLMGATTALTMLDVKAPVVRGIALAATNANRVVHVVVRSTVGVAMPNAQVIIRPGTLTAATASGLAERIGTSTARLTRPILGEAAPQAVREIARPDDLFATMTEVPDGVATACAVALPADLSDPRLQAQIDHNLDKIPVRCVPIEGDDTVVTIEVPPWPRFD